MASARTKKLNGNTICYGNSRPLPRPIPLRAGPLHLTFEAGTLRGIRLGKLELLKQIYAAVRDPNWLTVPGEVSRLRIDRTTDSFLVRYRCTHRRPPVHFVWNARIEGTSSGSIRFDMDGVARSTFARARIGLSVLHPPETCAGIPCEVRRSGGGGETRDRAVFPRRIDHSAPVKGFRSMCGMDYPITPDLRLRLRFTGDLFEMEDQRNWTDASFKTFSTPLNLPIPVVVGRGSRIRQSVSMDLVGTAPVRTRRSRTDVVSLTLGARAVHTLPSIGVGVPSHHQPLSAREVALLEGLGLSHQRFDLDGREPGWEARLRVAVGAARALRVPLEIAILNHRDRLPTDALSILQDCRAKIARWMLFPDSRRLARHLKRSFPEVPVGSGTNANFISFNEHPPKGDHLDFATFAIHPQTHATDNASLVETLEVQKAVALQARDLAKALPVVVSPVTLKPRFNPDAIAPEAPPADDELPPQVDPRQMSLFGAAWTLASLKYLAEAGVSSVTYYETTGWRGLTERQEGSPLPQLFPSLPGGAFPLYFVFAWLAPFRRAKVMPLVSDAALKVAGLAVRRGPRMRVLLANFTGHSETVAIEGVRTPARILILHEDNALSAMRHPDRFRKLAGKLASLATLAMPRYSLARIDL